MTLSHYESMYYNLKIIIIIAKMSFILITKKNQPLLRGQTMAKQASLSIVCAWTRKIKNHSPLFQLFSFWFIYMKKKKKTLYTGSIQNQTYRPSRAASYQPFATRRSAPASSRRTSRDACARGPWASTSAAATASTWACAPPRATST